MATYRTQIQWGGRDGDWHDDADLVIEIRNRNEVVPAGDPVPTGTQLSWSGPNGSANITFFNDEDAFRGSAQFPGEGPVGYRGQLK